VPQALTAALPPGRPVVPQAPPAAGGASGVLGALLLAFVGGLILNLMPCVLPVLSLKVMAFVQHAGDRRQAWRHGAAYTVGVLLSFWVLAGALLALRAGGEQVGWGFQLQSPAFVAFLACLFFVIGLNLFGVFEVGLSFTAAGGALQGRSGLGSSLAGGALATLVATPCTAPFMGSALGFGLTQPPIVSLLIFTALGLGMALPYLALSMQPALLRFVPRPGRWMETFKQLMGFFMMGTVVVLAWIFGQQAGLDALTGLLAGLLILGLAGWIYGRGTAPGAGVGARRVAYALSGVLALAGLFVGFTQAKPAPPAPASGVLRQGLMEWEPWSPERVAEARGQGRAVFIDFTAAWCLTCQVNERVAFGAAEVQARFKQQGIVALRADWTRRDDAITQALASYGRTGVPVYVLYAPGSDQPHLLPEVLSPGLVMGALDEHLGRPPR
jgi:thiol:disulfide interchange protein DsbD